jgi:hypothetical protein
MASAISTGGSVSDELTDTWPPRWKPGTPHFKKPVVLKAVRAKKTTKRATRERQQKDVVRDRDGYCRFPLCGCRKLKLPLESAHLKHKGMGGNPKEDLSEPEKLITLCRARHRTLPISMHAGTLRIKPLTEAGTAGPCEFVVSLPLNTPVAGITRGWFVVGRETGRHSFEPFTADQKLTLRRLAAMDL